MIAISFLCSIVQILGSDYFFQIQSEYRRDAVDFEEDVHEFYRQKLKVRFSEKSYANASFVYNRHTDSSKYTWNIFLFDISPYFSFFVGNFYAHFGKGLLVGKRSAFQADIFQRHGEIFKGNVISPATSGNPYFAFNGCGLMYQFSFEDIALRFHAFYSLKERYISQQEYESRSTLSSVWSIEKYDDRTNTRIEPIDMHTAATQLSLTFYRLFSLEVYGIRNEVCTPFNDDIALRNGVLHFWGIGLSAQYRDEFVNIFTEISSSKTNYRNKDDSQSENSGSAILSGLQLHTAHLKAFFAYKSAEKEYFSPYIATIGEYIGQGIFLDVRYILLDKVCIGGCFSLEKKSAQLSQDKDIPSVHREQIFFEYSYGVLHAMRLDYYRIYRTIDDDHRHRYRSSVSLGNQSLILFSVAGTFQKTNSVGSSYCATSSLSCFWNRLLSIHASWTRAWIKEGNPLYEYLFSLKNTNIPGTFLRTSGNIYVLKFVFSRWGMYFSCRGIYEISNDGIRDSLVEVFGSAQF